MKKILSLMAISGLLVAISSVADARSGPGGGASGFAPGQSFRSGGAIAGHPGASGYAPGHLKRAGSFRGASAFAPGHRFRQ
jgi:hypothetical protein